MYISFHTYPSISTHTLPCSYFHLSHSLLKSHAPLSLPLSIQQIISAIENLNVKQLPSEKAEILSNEFIATAEEVELLTSHYNSGKKMEDIDLFVYRVSV